MPFLVPIVLEILLHQTLFIFSSSPIFCSGQKNPYKPCNLLKLVQQRKLYHASQLYNLQLRIYRWLVLMYFSFFHSDRRWGAEYFNELLGKGVQFLLGRRRGCWDAVVARVSVPGQAHYTRCLWKLSGLQLGYGRFGHLLIKKPITNFFGRFRLLI